MKIDGQMTIQDAEKILDASEEIIEDAYRVEDNHYDKEHNKCN